MPPTTTLPKALPPLCPPLIRSARAQCRARGGGFCSEAHGSADPLASPLFDRSIPSRLLSNPCEMPLVPARVFGSTPTCGVRKYVREIFSSPVLEWLNKRLMSVSSPTHVRRPYGM
eukprot:9478295-Pyramimonas_sp.AAC.2